jgi:Maltooligosyl trehalose synthase
VDREDPRTGRAAAGLAGGRNDGVRVCERRDAVFVDPRGEAPLTELYAELTGERRTFAEIAHEAKLEVARTTFAPEFAQLRALNDDPRLEEAAAAMHVYRTYVEPEAGRVDDADRLAAGVLHDELRRIVLLEGERSPELDEFVVRWQQTTGPCWQRGSRTRRSTATSVSRH